MSTVWVKRLVVRNPNSRAAQRFLSGEVIIDCGSARISSEYLRRGCERGQHRLMYLAQTGAECGLSCHWFGNVGYQGTHGGAKVARDPWGSQADGPILDISGRSASPWTQPNTVRSEHEVTASSESGAAIFDLASPFICSHVFTSRSALPWWAKRSHLLLLPAGKLSGTFWFWLNNVFSFGWLFLTTAGNKLKLKYNVKC